MERCRKKGKDVSGTVFCMTCTLDTRQERQVLDLRREFLSKAGKIQKALNEERRKLADLISDPAPEQKTVFAALDRIGSLQTQLQKQVMELVLDEKSVLDSGQQTLFLGELEKRILTATTSKENWFETMQTCCDRMCPKADTAMTHCERR
jgi:Spy/CpxP family protein refolding chaperone